MTTRLLIIYFASLSFTGLGQKIEYTLSAPGDTTKNYYVTIFPKAIIKGAIVLLPGFGELPKQTLKDWDFHKHASNAGYLTIIPALGDWSFFYMDDLSHQKLKAFIDEIFKKYNLTENSFFIGGASLGGTMALQYAQRAHRDNSVLKKPVAVFALDPPLDIERLYNCMTTTNRPTKNPISIQEDNYITDRIQQEFKTNPKSNPQFFWKVSPYAQSDPEHTSLRTLLTIPIRVYNEPDINWYIENRSMDFYCINSLDSSAMINWLKSLGNSKAELIITSGKGYRVSSKTRHPHSWTIADGQELINWITEITTANKKQK
jgi:pimeloyl-ACP methyl ester carboxylesterase